MARKVRGFERVLDSRELFAVAYDEIGSSIYFALGIVAAQALGLTPVVLLVSGILFLVVSLSYAEGTAAIPETGGAATVIRRAFNDLSGFVTGWVLFLDYLIVIALSVFFLPHYLGAALSAPSLESSPWDVVVACFVIGAIARSGLFATRGSTRRRSCSQGSTSSCRCCSSSSGFVTPVLARDADGGLPLRAGQSWHDLAFALPLAMLAYTGLETVANLAEETREPGRALPRSLFSAIGLVVVVTVLISVVGVTAFPAEDGSTALGDAGQGTARRHRDRLQR